MGHGALALREPVAAAQNATSLRCFFVAGGSASDDFQTAISGM
jgi:hypothetical protein